MKYEETSKFKLQTSDKLQSSNFKFVCLLFSYSLVFDVWCLNFGAGGSE